MIVYGDEISAYGGNSDTTVFDSKFTVVATVPFLHCTDIYVDTDSVGRFVIGNNAVYASCTIKEPQPYTSWSDTLVTFTVFAPTITTKHLFFVSDNGTATYKGIMQDDGSLVL
jgi:hypothetical protein